MGQQLVMEVKVLIETGKVWSICINPRDNRLPLVTVRCTLGAVRLIVEQHQDERASARAELFGLSDFRPTHMIRQAQQAGGAVNTFLDGL